MRLSTAELRSLEKVLRRIEDDQDDPPRASGCVGQYLRQLGESRSNAVSRLGLDAGHPGSFSGEKLMPVLLTPIIPLQLRIRGDILGSVTSAVAANETAASTVLVTLWGAAHGAEQVIRIWRENPQAMVELSGDYRWHPPSRITPGRSNLKVVAQDIPWWEMRCLKYTGDDVAREPRAGSFHLDWLMKPYGVKAFRTLVITRKSGRWFALPALAKTAPKLDFDLPSEALKVKTDHLLVLAWAQPWNPRKWHVVKWREATADEVLAHNIAWADHIRELEELDQPTGEQIRELQGRLATWGVLAEASAAARLAPLVRRVDPKARNYAAWLRGVEVSQPTG